MTTVTFLRKEFEKEIKLTEKAIEKISLFGTPLEKITEEKIEIEIFPNRPDLISFHLYIRAFKNFIAKKPKIKKYLIKKPEENYRVRIDRSVKHVRPYTACTVVRRLKLDDKKIKEMIDVQEKLHATIGRNRKKVAIGIYPLEKIILPITYEALDPQEIKFIPIDEDREMNALQILQKNRTGKAYAHLLQNDEKKFPIFKDSVGKILSMPPIINSHETGKVTESTKDIFIECSGFDFGILSRTLNILVEMFAEMGGEVYQMILEYTNRNEITPDLTPKKMKLSLEKINQLLGLSLRESDLLRLLPKMGHEYKNKSAIISAARIDIIHEIDLIEDIAIAYGYDVLTPELPNIATIGQESEKSKFKSKLSKVLLGLNFVEISTYHLIKQHESELMKLRDRIEVEDSKTDHTILRPNLLIPALRVLAANKDHDYPQEFFEIGTVFSKSNKTETGIQESESLIVISSPANFTRMKQILNYVTESFNLRYQLEEANHQYLIDGRSATIKINNKKIGYLGEIHPETLRVWAIKMPTAAILVSLEEVFIN